MLKNCPSSFRCQWWLWYIFAAFLYCTGIEGFWIPVCTGVKPFLAQIPLWWMICECFKMKSGILFHIDRLKKIGLDPSTLYPIVLPRPPTLLPNCSSPQRSVIQVIPKWSAEPDYGDNDTHIEEVHESEEQLELQDALAPIYDQLHLARFWQCCS
jgi:hypothetical protein